MSHGWDRYGTGNLANTATPRRVGSLRHYQGAGKFRGESLGGSKVAAHVHTLSVHEFRWRLDNAGASCPLTNRSVALENLFCWAVSLFAREEACALETHL